MDGNFIIYILLVVIGIASIVVRKDTKEIIRRSDNIQKSLNAYIQKERNR